MKKIKRIKNKKEIIRILLGISILIFSTVFLKEIVFFFHDHTIIPDYITICFIPALWFTGVGLILPYE